MFYLFFKVNTNKIIDYKDLSNLNFSSFLAGFIENNGSIIVPQRDQLKIDLITLQLKLFLI
jgi:hypothetical protein